MCFRLEGNQTGVVFDEEDQDVSAFASTTISPDTIQSDGSPADKVGVTVGNRTKMIVANEISNLPRFDPKNRKMHRASMVTELPPMSDLSDTVEEVSSLHNASASHGDLFDSCQFCPEARFMQHYFAKGCIAMELQSECHPRFCPKHFDCPKEKELPSDGLCGHANVGSRLNSV